MNNLASGHNPTSSFTNMYSFENSNIINKYKTHNKLNIIFLNIRSLRKNFINFIAEINNITDNLDLIVLIETNITDYETNYFNTPNFNNEFINRENRRGGGIAVFIRDKYSYNISKSIGDSFE